MGEKKSLKIKILGRPISIEYCSGTRLDLLTDEKDTLGFFQGSTIFIKQSLNAEEKKRVFLHEVFHAMLSVGGLTNLLEERAEEAVCTVAESFADLLSDEAFQEHL